MKQTTEALSNFYTENSALEAFYPEERQKILKEVIIWWNGIFSGLIPPVSRNAVGQIRSSFSHFARVVFRCSPPANPHRSCTIHSEFDIVFFCSPLFCSNHELPILYSFIFSPTGSVSVSENGWNSQFSISPNVITHIPHQSIHPSIHPSPVGSFHYPPCSCGIESCFQHTFP